MTARQPPDLTLPTGGRARKIGRRVGVSVSATVLTALNLFTALLAVVTWYVTPQGDYDTDRLAAAGVSTFMGIGLVMVTVLLTIVPVAAHWLRKRWFIVPAVLFLILLARAIHLEVGYADLPDNYGFDHVPAARIQEISQ